MPPVAKITINAVPGSNDDLPIDDLVQLTNQNDAGVVSWLWEILDQPPGTTDNLSATNIHNPTYTPRKEGTTRLRLTVNQTLPTETSDTAIVGIRSLKTRERIPAAGETVEDSSTRGWAAAVGAQAPAAGAKGWLARLEQMFADGPVVTGEVGPASTLTFGDVAYPTGGNDTLKVGLPGQERIQTWEPTDFNGGQFGQVQGLMIARVSDGALTANAGELCYIRLVGPVYAIPGAALPGWPFAQSQPIFLGPGGKLTNIPTHSSGSGAIAVPLGIITSVDGGGGTFDVMFTGGGAYGFSGAGADNPHFGGVATFWKAHADHTTQVYEDTGGLLSILSQDTSGVAATLTLVGNGTYTQTGDLLDALDLLGNVTFSVGIDGHVGAHLSMTLNPDFTGAAAHVKPSYTALDGDGAGHTHRADLYFDGALGVVGQMVLKTQRLGLGIFASVLNLNTPDALAATRAELLLNATGDGTVQAGLSLDSGGVAANALELHGPAQLFFSPNAGAATWRIKTDGSLAGSNGAVDANQSILNVADPATAQGAASKNYVDTHAGLGPFIFGCAALPETGSAVYLAPWGVTPTNTEVFLKLVKGRTARRIIAQFTVAADKDNTFTLRQNGVNTALTVTIVAGQTEADATGDVVFTDGQTMSLSAKSAVAGAGAVNCTVQVDTTV